MAYPLDDLTTPWVFREASRIGVITENELIQLSFFNMILDETDEQFFISS